MSHHYIRHNYGDNCFYPDNAFKRYNRYNDSHGDTLIFNYNYGGGCGGGVGFCAGGSFWSGLGAGLANGLMGIFGGFMGGFGNIFGMGMPMFGMSMPMMGASTLTGGFPYSSVGGGNNYTNTSSTTNSSSSSSSSSTKHSGECNDADEMNAGNLVKKLETLKTNPDKAEIKKLYNQVKTLVDNPLDSAHAKGNKTTYKLLLDSIENLAKENGIDLTKPEAGTGETPEAKNVADANGTPETKNAADANGTPEAENAADANGTPVNDNDQISPEEAALNTKVADIIAKTPAQIKEAYPTTAERIGLLNKLKDKTDDDSVKARTLIKQSFYNDGNTNVKMSEFDDQAKRNEIARLFLNIIDTSNIPDIKGVTNTSIQKDENGKYKLTCQYKGKTLTYGEVEEKDGELIFHGMQMKKDIQHYVLQKNSKGKYELMQYEYHPGHGTADYIR